MDQRSIESVIVDPEGKLVERESRQLRLPAETTGAAIPYWHNSVVSQLREFSLNAPGPYAVHTQAQDEWLAPINFEVA